MQPLCNLKYILTMPANLNALIRYKTINSLLYGGKRRCDIYDLISACTEVLYEARGRDRDKLISERQIRDDLRVMRSDILGFNAPIMQEGGLYFYSDDGYSIMSVGLTDPGLVEKIVKLLLDLRTEVIHPELEIVLEKLLPMVPAISLDGLIKKKVMIKEDTRLFNIKYSLESPLKNEFTQEEYSLKTEINQFNIKTVKKVIPPSIKATELISEVTWDKLFSILANTYNK